MNQRLSRALSLGRAMLKEARAENITFLAGSLAYHAFISLLPLLVLLLVAITTLGTESMETGFLALVRGLLSPGGSDVELADLFVAELRAASQSTGLSVVGATVLLWGTMRIFRGIDTAFSEVYETETANTFLDQFGDALVVLVAFVAAIVLAGVLQRLLPVRTALSGLALAGTLVLTLYPMYYVFPDTDVSVIEVVPGTLFAAVGLTLLESLFRFYLTLGGSGSQPTVISGVVVLLTWLYFASLVLLLGVVVNAVLSNRSQDVQVVPVFGDHMPTQGGTRDGETVPNKLQRLEHLFATEAPITITAGDQTVTLPAPLSVSADTESSGFEFGAGQFGLTLRWADIAPDESDTAESTTAEATSESDGSESPDS